MGSIGLGYFMIVMLAWIYEIQEKKAFQELTLLIANRLLLTVSIFYSLIRIYELYVILASLHMAPVPDYYSGQYYLTGGVIVFLLLLSLFLMIPYIAKNIWYSSGMAIVVLYQVISSFYPPLAIENIIYEFFKGSVDASWISMPSNYLYFFTDNLIFILIWFFFYHHLKKRTKLEGNLDLENHLIQN